MSRSSKLQTITLTLTCLILLTGCNPKQIEPRAAAVAKESDPAARRAEIMRQLRALCPQANQWTPVQMRTVAAFIRKYAKEEGLVLLAQDWQRITRGARICRGEA